MVIKDFVFFAQPKYRIASARPGSGNTKNIGSVTRIDQMLQGNGPFAQLGEDIFDDYWMYYLTNDMVNKLNIPRPYIDLKTYAAYKERGARITPEVAASLEELDTGPGLEEEEGE